MKSYNDKALSPAIDSTMQNQLVGDNASFEMMRLPFSVSIVDAETHLCAICQFNYKYMMEDKNDEAAKQALSCKGCDIYQSGDKVKWILGCFKKLEVYIDWIDP
jgi:hypothetical protein